MKRDGYGRHARSIVRSDRPETVTVDVAVDWQTGAGRPLAPQELRALFGRMASQRIPILRLRAHDGAARADIDELIGHAAGLRLRVGLDLGGSWTERPAPGKRPAASLDRLRTELRRRRAAGLDQVELDLDVSADAAAPAATQRLVEILDRAHALGLAVGVRTPLAADAPSRVRELAALLGEHAVDSWQISFFDCRPGGARHVSPSAHDVHATFADLYSIEHADRIALRVVEAPHYRRYRIERERYEQSQCAAAARPDRPGPTEAAGAVSDRSVREAIASCCGLRADIGAWRHAADAGRPYLFVDRYGEVYPSERLPISAGNVRERALIDIYRSSDVFMLLRDTERLDGKCSRCGFRRLCGGSRARAWHKSGNCMGTDPACAFGPVPDAEVRKHQA